MRKRASVVIPVRNRSDLLKRCLSALAAQDFPLDQCEVLVCDDGSSEDLRPVVALFRGQIPTIRLIRLGKPKGPAAARNLGIRASSAPLIVCVDSDIVCDREFLTRIVGVLETHPQWVAAEGAVLPVGGTGSLLDDAPTNQHGGSFLSGASAYRTEALSRAGGYDEEFPLPACEDAELAARILPLGKFGFVANARVFHPVRRVTARTHWLWHRHWRYEMILAQRYGFLAFPGNDAGRFPRLRVALAAVINLPAGRFLDALKRPGQRAGDRFLASLYAVLDVLCGLWALPQILLGGVPQRRNYLTVDGENGLQIPRQDLKSVSEEP